MLVEIERCVVPKSGDVGADRVVVTSELAAVIDGTTVSEPCECCGDRAGEFAADVVVSVVESSPSDGELASFLAAVTRAIRAAAAGRECRGRSWSASAAVCSDTRQEVWLIGDAAAIVGGRVWRASKKVDHVAAEFRSAVIRAALAGGSTVDELLIRDVGREAIGPLLVRQRFFRNDIAAGDLGWAALGPERTPVELCLRIDIPGGVDGYELILASDGYPDLRPTLADSESALERRLAEDPLLIGRHPATKGVRPGARSFDDRAYVRLRSES